MFDKESDQVRKADDTPVLSTKRLRICFIPLGKLKHGSTLAGRRCTSTKYGRLLCTLYYAKRVTLGERSDAVHSLSSYYTRKRIEISRTLIAREGAAYTAETLSPLPSFRTSK